MRVGGDKPCGTGGHRLRDAAKGRLPTEGPVTGASATYEQAS